MARRPTKKSKKQSVTVVLLTLNGSATIEAVILSLLEQHAPIDRVLVVDSSSTDGTVEKIWEMFREGGKENLLHIIKIPQSEFHHARTMHVGNGGGTVRPRRSGRTEHRLDTGFRPSSSRRRISWPA